MYQNSSKPHCILLAVLCGGEFGDRKDGEPSSGPAYPFPELASSGRLEIQTLVNPTGERFREALGSAQPTILYLQGQRHKNEEVGSLVWGGVDVSHPETLTSLLSTPYPTIVYLEVPNGERIAEEMHSKGCPYVIYWKHAFSTYAASHFRQALLSVVQSSCSHMWDAFQLAHASFSLYCVQNNYVLPRDSQNITGKLGPRLLGAPAKIKIDLPEINMDEEEGPSEPLPAIKIYDEDVDTRFLVCGLPCTLDACLLGSLEDGLNALLNIEIRGSRLLNRVRAIR